MRAWRCGAFSFPWDRPIVMGILNVTPDSFSDGGTYVEARFALNAAHAMLSAGADIIDVGGESTRPGSVAPSTREEIARVEGVVANLSASGACVSIDTRHAEVARAAVAAGASIINDVSGFEDPAMVEVAVESGAGLVVMHMQGDPRTMQVDPRYDDVVREVADYLAGRASALLDAGVDPARICIDPGIGFGKTTAHNLELLRRTDELTRLGYPVLIGASRKRFVGEITGVDVPRDRVAGSVAVAIEAVQRGALCVRVHDVPETVQALRMIQAVEGSGNERG
jgi:dihydropteroate synthase